jgi:(p)ppGpp synthase/HD superfamily hydrolase
MTSPRPLTPAFEDALVYAARLHAGQARKRSDTPYISHLMSVAALVLEFGGSLEQAIAGLLHGAIEDQANGFPGPRDASAALVAFADKLHNARTMLADYRVLGDELWSRFNAAREDQVWYLRSVLQSVGDRVPRAMLAELDEIVERLNAPPGEFQQLPAVSSARVP